MSNTSRYRQPQEVASRLEVSPSTLRRWSEEFSDFLSPEADSSEGKQHRRYSDEDLATFITVKGLMAEGLTYEQVRERLSEQSASEGPASEGSAGSISMVAADPALPLAPAMTFLADSLHNVADSQQAVLNSQAANRELLGVVLQDNFNLKEENTRMRDRMLELERQISQLRRDEESRRESLRAELEGRMQDVQRMVMLQSRSGCLGGLFGSSRSR
jgi:DNA-binding transcriptional MerR regulator